MELSDPVTPDTSVDLNGTANRRKSGRARQKPVLLNKDPNIPQYTSVNGKRKRAETRAEDVQDLSEDEDESSQSESEPDEEELKEKRRKAARSRENAAKPATKKTKTGPNLNTSLAVRPAVNGLKKAQKSKQPRARPLKNVEDAGTGLYAEIFSQGHTVEAVAADWITRWEQNNAAAMRDLVNLVLRCTGCKIEVDIQDIEDSDNIVSKLTDIQEEFQADKITDYPLISKGKGNASFRSTMVDFFDTLIKTCHASGLLYSEVTLYENLDLWVSTMSSSSIRPFRHTATVISLAMGSALCTVANDLAESAAKTRRQKEGEQKKKSVNKERIKGFEARIADDLRKRTSITENVQQLFDQVYVHRYRDVDPKIRVDCVSALGNWINTLPDHFFEGIYLRYLGWVLSDAFASTRVEVIRQLSKLFKNKDNVARLRTFTEKFRARLVEMAARDAEVGVRVPTVELLDTIRKTGLLEPDDIDNVGRLIFDAEPRIRKAVAGFFAENINDLFEATLEDFGGEEGLAEILGDEVEDDYDTPRISWLKLKCIAEALESYDAENEDNPVQRENGSALIASGGDSRYSLAAQIIHDGIPEARDWETLTGYLLYDFSSAESANEEEDSAFIVRCKPNEKEEILLLEVLNAAVKGNLLEVTEGENEKKGKRTKAQKEEAKSIQEATALHLAKIIPRLLKKFGSSSTTVKVVLRLEHVLNLEIFKELRQDSTMYAALLDDINRQFLTHADQGVLVEASTAFLHARSFDDLDEVTEEKLGDLWDETINALRTLMEAEITDNIAQLCHTVRRIENLASICDCSDVFDHETRPQAKKKSSAALAASPKSMLIKIIQDPALDSEAGEQADELVISAIKSLLFYYMWITRNLQSAIASKETLEDLPDYSSFSETLISAIDSRHKLSPVRIAATGTLLDLHTLFATFRHTSAQVSSSSSSSTTTIDNLIQHIPPNAHNLILSTYTALEKSYAKKSRKTLEIDPDEDLASVPEDSSDDDDDEDEDEDETEDSHALAAEHQLCELTGKIVLAIVARVLDHEGGGGGGGSSQQQQKGKIRQRLQVNKARLGHNFKEVIAYLDGPKTARKQQPKRKAAATAAAAAQKGKKGGSKSKEVVDDDDESEEEGEEVQRFEEGGEQDLRERELVEDRIVDFDGDGDGGEDGAGGGAGAGAARDDIDDDDDVMGD